MSDRTDDGNGGRTFLLLWNPAGQNTGWGEWSPRNYTRIVNRTAAGDTVLTDWSTGNRKDMEPGERFFMYRVGEERGIIGSGIIRSQPYSDGSKNFADLEFVNLVRVEDRLPIEEIVRHRVNALAGSPGWLGWNSLRASGTEIPASSATKLESLWQKRLATIGRGRHGERRRYVERQLQPAIDALAKLSAMEGQQAIRDVLFRLRNRTLIAKRKSGSDCRCEICKFKFSEKYGVIGATHIIAHHTKPLGSRNGASKTRLTDIALVCDNCHAMLHTSEPPLSVETLRRMVRRQQNANGHSMRQL